MAEYPVNYLISFIFVIHEKSILRQRGYYANKG